QARRRGIPVIVATQMLESMITNAAPTRAEATDVANAVYEGADALMLSAESAAGAYPKESVAMMDRIIGRVERDPRWPILMAAEPAGEGVPDLDPTAAAAAPAAQPGGAACLVAFPSRGAPARRIVRERPPRPVLALTPSLDTARRLSLGWGV